MRFHPNAKITEVRVAEEVHVAELKQLFNSIDPSPFRNKDLDPRAEEFITELRTSMKQMDSNAWSGLASLHAARKVRQTC